MEELRQDNVTEQEGNHSNGVRKFVFIALVLVSAVLLILILRTRATSTSATHLLTTAEQSRQSYQRILGETHTGLRLARLADFLEHAPESADIASARIQHGVLQMHEQHAWAELSETIYAIDASIGGKTQARDEYIETWSTLLRTDKLDRLPLTPPEKIVQNSASQTANTDTIKTASLAGAPKTKKPKTKTRANRVERNPAGRVVNARIRKTRTPIYPSRAHRRGIEALVVLSLTINERGRVTHTKTLEVETERYRSDFIRAAKRAARRTRFHPKTIDGQPVKTRAFERRYRFSVKD